jgi:hypothetical protein
LSDRNDLSSSAHRGRSCLQDKINLHMKKGAGRAEQSGSLRSSSVVGVGPFSCVSCALVDLKPSASSRPARISIDEAWYLRRVSAFEILEPAPTGWPSVAGQAAFGGTRRRGARECLHGRWKPVGVGLSTARSAARSRSDSRRLPPSTWQSLWWSVVPATRKPTPATRTLLNACGAGGGCGGSGRA